MLTPSLRIRFTLAALAFSLSALAYGHETIVGGSFVAKGDPIAKFTVLVRFTGRICSGTLITRNIVLTAAHCAIDEATQRIIAPGSSVDVLFDRFESEKENYPYEPSVSVPAAKIIIDRGYIGEDSRVTGEDYGFFNRKTHDVALIRLAKDAPADFAPIPLARRSEIEAYANTAVVAGYGRERKEEGSRYGRLKAAKVRITENGSYYARIVADWGDGNVCFGDSGGPLLIKTPREGYKLAGAIDTTWNHQCVTGTVTRVEDYADFFAQAMPRLGSSADGLFTVAPPAKPRSSWPSF